MKSRSKIFQDNRGIRELADKIGWTKNEIFRFIEKAEEHQADSVIDLVMNSHRMPSGK